MIANTFKSQGQDIPWTVYEPSTPNGSAVVIAYGSDGLSTTWEPEIRAHAQGLANVGILALIPHYLQLAPSISDGDSDAVFASILTRYEVWPSVP